MADWYCGSTKHTAIAQWAANHAYSVGDIVRQLAAPAVGSERAFRWTTAGTSGGSEPSWTLTKGATTNDNGAVWTEVTGNSTYGWAAAFARLVTPLSVSGWLAAGDRVWLSNNHAETNSADVSWGVSAGTTPGSATSPVQIICVDDSATPPTAKATTATVTLTGARNMSVGAFLAFYGLTLDVGTSGSNCNLTPDPGGGGVSGYLRMEKCKIKFSGGGSSLIIGPDTTGTRNARAYLCEFIDTTFHTANANDTIKPRMGKFIWRGSTSSALPGATLPTTLFTPLIAYQCDVRLEGVDLSALGSGKNLVSQGINVCGTFLFKDCKQGASVTRVTGTINSQGGVVSEFINSNSGDVENDYANNDFEAVESTELTIIRANGASAGGVGLSRKIVTNANPKIFTPYCTKQRPAFFNTIVGQQITVNVAVLTDNVTLTDAEAWIEVEYMGTSGFPLGLYISDRVSDWVFGTPTNQDTDTASVWITTGLSTPVQQVLSVSFTPQEVGLVCVRVCIAKASTTVYYDPKILDGSFRQYQTEGLFINEGLNTAFFSRPGAMLRR